MQASKPNNELVPMLEEFPKWLFDVSVPLLPEPPKWKFPNPKLLLDSTCTFVFSDPQWAKNKKKKNRHENVCNCGCMQGLYDQNQHFWDFFRLPLDIEKNYQKMLILAQL